MQDVRLIPVRYPKGETKQVIVDEADFKWLSRWSWQLSRKDYGYARRTARGVDGKKWGTIYMHRLILGLNNNLEVDHINGNRLDNRRANLRQVDRSMQLHNVHRPRGVSKHRGVEVPAVGRPVARLMFQGKRVYLGRYDTIEEAASAAEAKRVEYMVKRQRESMEVR